MNIFRRSPDRRSPDRGPGPGGFTRKTTTALAGGVMLSLALAGCGSGGGDDATEEEQTLSVFAAASLTDSFEDLAGEFEEQHPGVDVELNFAGSSTLVTQLQDGAPADVFASADEANMDKAVDAGLVNGEPSIFATNLLTIAVPAGNPAGITSFEDLAGEGVNVVVCEQRVPCGAATERIEEITGTTLSPVSEESAVTDVMGKVTSGQADAGVVYKTDVTAAGDAVEEVEIAQTEEAINRYPIAALESSADADLAREFIDFIQGSRGQERLAEEGFGAP
ncbi:molybdate ABC transporter substrate-binding protein [Kocuria coralli]|uniref:Molybdate-binding protein ModA n=1 Tax=Kocuria coralli TaxID=1461025 RepID=A0A5J5KYR1_9MICC|nr:molybdate ABC transporter substrate-binding protein [Kocuria coralli]KAA9393901.1 molybdate ABC transporter substrate-binding protein [Kocuria coralli]